MLFPGIKKLGKSLGLARSGSVAMGNVDNSYIRLYDGRNQKVLEFFFPKVSAADKTELTGYLKANKVKKHEWSGDTLVVTFPEYFKPYPIGNIRALIEYLRKFARERYPDDKVACQKCNASTEASSYSLGNAPMYLCEDCMKNLELELRNNKQEYDAVPTNYARGTIGALTFAIPGILATAILFVFLNSIAALSAVIYVLLATKGYAAFKGKTDKVGACILTITGIVFSCVGIAVSYAASIAYQTKSLAYTVELLKKPEIQRELNTNILLALVLCSLYLALNFINLLGEWKFPTLEKARKI